MRLTGAKKEIFIFKIRKEEDVDWGCGCGCDVEQESQKGWKRVPCNTIPAATAAAP